jgi:hypothetical protein
MKRAIARHREAQRKKQCRGESDSVPTASTAWGPLHKWGGAHPPFAMGWRERVFFAFTISIIDNFDYIAMLDLFVHIDCQEHILYNIKN